MELQEQKWAIVKEYTRQILDLFNTSEFHWTGTDDYATGEIDCVEIRGEFCLTFCEVQTIVDNMDEWMKRYGSKQALAECISMWLEWAYLKDDGATTPTDAETLHAMRMNRFLNCTPRINLRQWLLGMRPKDIEKEDETPFRHMCTLEAEHRVVKDLMMRYRPNRTLWNVADGLAAEIEEIRPVVEEDMKKSAEEMRLSPLFGNFEQAAKEGDLF